MFCVRIKPVRIHSYVQCFSSLQCKAVYCRKQFLLHCLFIGSLSVNLLTIISQNSICSNHKWHGLWQSYQQGRNYVDKNLNLLLLLGGDLSRSRKSAAASAWSLSWCWLVSSGWISRIITDNLSKAESSLLLVGELPSCCLYYYCMYQTLNFLKAILQKMVSYVP